MTNFLITNSENEELDFDVCKFGILMALEVGINVIIALLLSLIIGMIGYGILFLIIFSLLRAFAGGVHLDSFWKCTMLSSFVLLAVLLTVKYVNVSSIISLEITIVFGISVFIIGPIDDRNHRILRCEYILFNRRLAYTLLSIIIISILCVILNFERLAFLICITMVLFNLVQILGKQKNLM